METLKLFQTIKVKWNVSVSLSDMGSARNVMVLVFYYQRGCVSFHAQRVALTVFASHCYLANKQFIICLAATSKNHPVTK